jgi:hypothetical protein
MENLNYFVGRFMNLDTHLKCNTNEYGLLTYLLLFSIIFCENGLVITPFLRMILLSLQLELWLPVVHSIYLLY